MDDIQHENYVSFNCSLLHLEMDRQSQFNHNFFVAHSTMPLNFLANDSNFEPIKKAKTGESLTQH